jgi:hypothetical protein
MRPPINSPKRGAQETLPREGLIPKTPLQDAGQRIEPPPSVPSEIGHRPAARAAPPPPVEPPGVR